MRPPTKSRSVPDIDFTSAGKRVAASDTSIAGNFAEEQCMPEAPPQADGLGVRPRIAA
jgi:hypothetical protein